jgi:hypothetical protein
VAATAEAASGGPPPGAKPTVWERHVSGPASRLWTGGIRQLRSYLHEPEYSRLRWIFLAGLLVRVILAPLTSWSVDTLGFARTGVVTLYTGNPYSAGSYFNAPLAPFLAIPSVGIVTWIWGPNGLFVNVSAMTPIAQATMFPTVLPTPAVLLAWKFPLIVADMLGGLAIYYWTRRYLPGISADLTAAAWLLNPLVIWSSSVHGEVDGLAAALVLLAMVTAASRHWFTTGVLLSLSIFAKGYTLLLVPVFLVWAVVQPGPTRDFLRAGVGRIVAGGIGLATGVLVFWPFIPETFSLLSYRALSNATYGGVSLLIVFNPVVPPGPAWWQQWTASPTVAHDWWTAFQVLAALAVIATLVALVFRLRSPGLSETGRASALALGLSVVSVATILANAVPNSENLVVFVGVWILCAGAVQRFWWWLLLAGITVAGLVEYWVLLTPFAFFYPLAVAVGPGAVTAINGVAVPYYKNVLLRGSLWETVGVIGGTLLWIGLAAGLLYLIRPLLKGHFVRHRRNPDA